MERLLADASKLSGVKYDLDNLGDVYEAIHVIQGELGLTGVAAAEAEGTFTGSMQSMKASIKNLMGNLALGNDISKDLEIVSVSLRTFVTKNALPLLGNVLKAIPSFLKQAIPEISSFITEMLSMISSNSKEIEATAINIVRELVLGLIKAAPQIISGALNLIATFKKTLSETHWEQLAKELLTTISNALTELAPNIFGEGDVIANIVDALVSKVQEALKVGTELLKKIMDGITKALPTVLSVGLQLVQTVIAGILESLPAISEAAIEILGSLAAFLTENLPIIISFGFELLRELINGVLAALPELVTLAANLISMLAEFLMENLPALVSMGWEMLFSLAEGIVEQLPYLIDVIATALGEVLSKIAENLPEFLKKGWEIILQIGEGIMKLIGHIPELMQTIFNAAWNVITSIDWLGLGKTIIDWIWGGISSVASNIWNKLKEIGTNALNNFKNINWYQLGYDVITFILNGIKSIIQQIPTLITNTGKQIVDGLKNAIQQIPTILKNIGTTAVNTVKSIDWAGLGRAIINGIVNGLKAIGSTIKNTLMEFAKGAFNAAKDFFRIGSPSKLFRDEIGKNIMLGMAEGIERNADAVSEAMDEISAETVLAIEPATLAANASSPSGANVFNITVNPSAGMDEQALADMVIQRITFTMQQAQAAWG